MEEIQNFGLNFNNFDPEDLNVDEVINCLFVIDQSGSVGRYVKEMNDALNDFLHTMQKSHVSDKILISTLVFDDNIKVVNGYQPIENLSDFNVVPGGMTNLYGATYAGILNAEDYRKTLEKSGGSVKSIVFIITDGEDNCGFNPQKIKDKLDEIYSDELNAFTFTVIMFGVGNAADFNLAAKKMGIKPEMVKTVGTSGKEIKKMISFISSSISTSANGGTVDSISF